MMWGRSAPPLGRLACCCTDYKYHSFLAALSLKHNYKTSSQVQNSSSQFHSLKIHLVEVIFELGKKRKFESESVAQF